MFALRVAAFASCGLLIDSAPLIGALLDLLKERRVKVDGIYDRTQMADVYRDGGGCRRIAGRSARCRTLLRRAGIVGKNSTPYTPTSRHDFMHNKILVIDDTVITGSYNFSRSAQFNAENILFIESAALAERYSVYIDHLMQKYGATR